MPTARPGMIRSLLREVGETMIFVGLSYHGIYAILTF